MVVLALVSALGVLGVASQLWKRSGDLLSMASQGYKKAGSRPYLAFCLEGVS